MSRRHCFGTTCTDSHHWLKVKLIGTKSNRSAIGARVLVRYGKEVQAQALTSQSSFYSVERPETAFRPRRGNDRRHRSPLAERTAGKAERNRRRSAWSRFKKAQEWCRAKAGRARKANRRAARRAKNSRRSILCAAFRAKTIFSPGDTDSPGFKNTIPVSTLRLRRPSN